MSEAFNHFPDPAEQKPYEEGFPLPQAPKADQLPPGGGGDVLPHFVTFSQIVNYASRVYRFTHDEALRDNWTNALAIRRDPVIMDALRSRQMPTAQLPWHLECEDDQDSRQAEAVEAITDVVNLIPRFQQLKMHLLEALWFGRYGVQMAYQWRFKHGQKFLSVRNFKPINGDKLVFRFSGQPGILVHQQYQGDWEQTDRGRAHFFSPHERDQLIIHRHEPEDADFFEPELGGSLQGVGIRGRIYWLWYLRSQVTAFLMDYLERCGAGGFTIYYYEAGSQTSANEVTQAVQSQWRNNAIMFPRYRDGEKGGPGIDRIEPSTAGAQLMQALVTQYFDSVMRRYILGQNLTTEAESTGLGSGLADLHGETFARYIKYDAINLADTLSEELIAVLQKNSPYCDLPPLKFCFDVDKPNANETLQAAQVFFDMGGSIDEDQLRSVIGLEKPAPGHAMLAKMGAMSPASAGSVPAGVPMLGQPGPDMGGMMSSEAGGMPPEAAGGQQPPMMMRRKGRPRLFSARTGAKVALGGAVHGDKHPETGDRPWPKEPEKKAGENPPSPIDNTSPIGDNTSGGGEKPKPEEPKMTTQELPKLTGSEKQVAWAEKIRDEKISDAEKWLAIFEQQAASETNPALKARHEESAAAYREALQLAHEHADSRWWIDNRSTSLRARVDQQRKERSKTDRQRNLDFVKAAASEINPKDKELFNAFDAAEEALEDNSPDADELFQRFVSLLKDRGIEVEV